MNRQLAYSLFWIICSLALILVSQATRSIFVLDETRYLGVAWEMWTRGDFLVPFRNGLPYSHKPPFLFWTFHLGWSVFGVNQWWPRLVPSLFALACLFLTRSLGRRMWPQEPLVAVLAPTMLLGTLFWAVYSTMTMFDLVLAFWVLVGVTGVWRAGQGDTRGWWLAALGIGFGILTKGPVALLHILPVALIAPWWSQTAQAQAARWYGTLLLALAGGAAIALAWAIPAAIEGGEEYRHAIFWGQTAGRVAQSFAHERKWWWYFPTLPLVLFPWFFWWPAWRGLKGAGQGTERGHFRFLLAWIVPVFVAFSAISGKQVQYLLPLYPALTLLVAAGLVRRPRVSPLSLLPVFIVLSLLAILLLAAPALQQEMGWPEWVAGIPPWSGALIIGIGALLLWLGRRGKVERQVAVLALTSVATIVVLYLAVLKHVAPAYEVDRAARVVAELQHKGIPVLHVGNYHSKFHFAGRLTRPLDVVMPGRAAEWARNHPDGWVVAYTGRADDPLLERAQYVFPYRGEQMVIIRAADWPNAGHASPGGG